MSVLRTAAEPEQPASPGSPGGSAAVRGFFRKHETTFWRRGTLVAAVVPFVGLAFTIIVIAIKGWPAIRVNGTYFFTGSSWNPGSTYGATTTVKGVAVPQGASYGAWPLILGTIQSSVIALLIAIPISIGAALALTERLPKIVARPVGFAVELLAGIPSVLFGLWGILTVGPLLARDVYPKISSAMPNVPILNFFKGPTGQGEGLFTSGIILAIMVIPIITATTVELFRQVPPLNQEGARALGMTDAEVTRSVTVPWVRNGIIGASILGLGRALGETIAIAMISGAILGHTAQNIYSPMTTIAATIVSQLDSSFTDATGFATATLAEAALVLAVISVVVNLLARLIVNKGNRLGVPTGK
jgi:phosphate transport system permease protein